VSASVHQARRHILLLWDGIWRSFCKVLAFTDLPTHLKGLQMIKPFPRRGGRRIALATLAAFSAPLLLSHSPAVAASPAEAADRVSYVLFAAGSGSSSMSGSMEDMHSARSLRRGEEGLLYIRHRGMAYVIRDAATLREAEAIFAPQQALGAKQAELGSRQAELGQRQAQLGAEQGRLAALQADARASRGGGLGRQQNELGRRQGELGQQQGQLGRQQGELGREQARLARLANEKIRLLIEQAIQRGVAQRVN
jgi:hypothetical protein